MVGVLRPAAQAVPIPEIERSGADPSPRLGELQRKGGRADRHQKPGDAMQMSAGARTCDAQHADRGEQQVGQHVMHEQGGIVNISDRESGQRADALRRRKKQPEDDQSRKRRRELSPELNRLAADRQGDPDDEADFAGPNGRCGWPQLRRGRQQDPDGQ